MQNLFPTRVNQTAPKFSICLKLSKICQLCRWKLLEWKHYDSKSSKRWVFCWPFDDNSGREMRTWKCVQVLLAWLRLGWQSILAVNRQRMLWGDCLGIYPNTQHIRQTVYSLCSIFFHQTLLAPFFNPNWYIPRPHLWCKCGSIRENTVSHTEKSIND